MNIKGLPSLSDRLFCSIENVYRWRIHFDIWQNYYSYVKFKNKIKFKNKQTKNRLLTAVYGLFPGL